MCFSLKNNVVVSLLIDLPLHLEKRKGKILYIFLHLSIMGCCVPPSVLTRHSRHVGFGEQLWEGGSLFYHRSFGDLHLGYP